MKGVLVVEDNALNATLAEAILEDAAYRVLMATTAEDGLRIFQAEKPDVIVMDVQLPGMNGITAIAHFRPDPIAAWPRIVAVTAQALHGDRERILSAGFDAYLSKPYSRQHLLDVVEGRSAG